MLGLFLADGGGGVPDGGRGGGGNYTLFLGFNIESVLHFEQLGAFGRDTYC
jgi:hypothetical protein